MGTAGQGDEPFMVIGQKLLIYPWFVVEAFEVGFGD